MPTTPLGRWYSTARESTGSTADVLGLAQQGGAATGVVPRHDGAVGHLLVGVRAGLARLELHEVEQLGLPVEHEVVHPQQHRGALLDRGRGPPALGAAGRVDRDVDVTGRRQRQHREGRPRHRGAGQLLAAVARGHDPGRERPDPGRVHGVRCVRIGLGVSDDFGHYRRVTTPPVNRRTFVRSGTRGVARSGQLRWYGATTTSTRWNSLRSR